MKTPRQEKQEKFLEKERDFSNVRRRTRKAMIEAVTRLVHEGASPSVTEVADAAGVSRATAYRYFPTQESLLAEVIVPRRCPRISRVASEPHSRRYGLLASSMRQPTAPCSGAA